jgi:hypothetical protein
MCAAKFIAADWSRVMLKEVFVFIFISYCGKQPTTADPGLTTANHVPAGAFMSMFVFIL